jgi:hypothetical protein
MDVIEERVGGLDFNPASLAPPVLHAEDEDPATQVRISAISSRHSSQVPIQALTIAFSCSCPLASAAVRSGLGSIDDYLRVEVSQRPVGVSAVEGLVHPTHDLDVLLRHRPRSISRIGEGASGGGRVSDDRRSPQRKGNFPEGRNTDGGGLRCR